MVHSQAGSYMSQEKTSSQPLGNPGRTWDISARKLQLGEQMQRRYLSVSWSDLVLGYDLDRLRRNNTPLDQEVFTAEPVEIVSRL